MKLRARMLTIMAVAASIMPMPILHAQNGATSSGNTTSVPVASSSMSDAMIQPTMPASASLRERKRDTSRVEVFLGYSRFGTASTDTVAGNRVVGMNGGSTSIAFNLNRYLGLVADFGGYDDNRLQLTGTGANQAIVVNSSGIAYSYLFGPRLSFFKRDRFSPFVQVLAGRMHASSVTVSGCSGPECTPLPTQNTFAMVAGGGLDIRVTHHISIRAVQAEYMMTRFDGVPDGGSASQNDLRLSSGLLFGFGGKTSRPPVQLTCSLQPERAFSGNSLMVTATATDLDPKKRASYTWSTNGGIVSASETTAGIDTAGLAPGTYVVSGHVAQGDHVSQQASCTASFTIQPFEPPTIACSASQSMVTSGDSVGIAAQAMSPQNRPLTYSYSATSGKVTGDTSSATLSTTGVGPGPVTVTCNVVDDLGKSASADVSMTVMAPVAAAAPQTSELCTLSFEIDTKRPTRVNNEAKGCLDGIALQMQRDSEGRLVIVGNYADGEKPGTGAQRTLNVRQYLTEEKGIDSRRIELRVGTAIGRTVTNTFVPSGATYNDGDTTPVDTTNDHLGKTHGETYR